MLIVCPTCATSYMIDPASVGPAGRAVRCARCKSTWFAGGPKTEPNVTAFVDGVIAEAEAQSNGTRPKASPPQRAEAASAPPAPDDFGAAPPDPFPPASENGSSPVDHATYNTDLAPREDEAHEAVPMADAPSLVPPIEHAPLLDGSHADGESEDIESFAVRRERLKARRQKSKRSSRWTAIILVLFAFNVALIGARNEVVRYVPQTASLFASIGLPVNLRHLKFDKVRITKEEQDGVSILIIQGTIVNTTSNPTEVPRLRFAARNATGQDVYTWTMQPTRSILGPGESMEFQSRLAAPPSNANDVMVRFFTAQDAAAGAK